MTGAQIIRQFQYVLDARNWTGTSNNVFGSVDISARPINALLPNLQAPFAVVRPFMSSDGDPQYKEQPELMRGRVEVAIGVVGGGDFSGEKALIGGNRVTNDSQGRGILELEKELYATIGRMGPDLGLTISAMTATVGPSGQDQAMNYVATREHGFEIWYTTTEFYHPATYFRATGGAGQVILQWEASPDRYDWEAYRIEYASGGTAPATTGSGTVVTVTGGRLQENRTVTGLSAGTYSFSLWVAYNDIRGSGNQDNYSARVTRTSITVT